MPSSKSAHHNLRENNMTKSVTTEMRGDGGLRHFMQQAGAFHVASQQDCFFFHRQGYEAFGAFQHGLDVASCAKGGICAGQNDAAHCVIVFQSFQYFP